MSWGEFLRKMESGEITQFTIHYNDGTTKTSDEIIAEFEQEQKERNSHVESNTPLAEQSELEEEITYLIEEQEEETKAEEPPSPIELVEQRKLRIQRFREAAKGSILNDPYRDEPTRGKARSWRN
jgi:hypothetical protein